MLHNKSTVFLVAVPQCLMYPILTVARSRDVVWQFWPPRVRFSCSIKRVRQVLAPELPADVFPTLCIHTFFVVVVLALPSLVEPLDMERVLIGEQSPMFFGSAMTNFGVELFLKRFLTIGQKPASRRMGVSF